MDWNTILFVARWVMITLFYFVLLVLVFAVYKEASSRLPRKVGAGAESPGHLRVIQPGSDRRLAAGTILDLNAITSLGANRDNDIVLGDQYVSAHHLKLHWDGMVWWLEDLNSKNGTLINRQPCPANHPRALPRGAFINVGDMLLELVE